MQDDYSFKFHLYNFLKMLAEQRLTNTSIKFENLELKSKSLQITYFLFGFIFSVPIIITVFDGHSLINRHFKIQESWLRSLDQFSTQYQSMVKSLIVFLVGLLCASWYYVILYKNPIILKGLFVLMLMIDIVGNFTSWTLIGMVLNANSSISLVSMALIGILIIQVHWFLIEKCWITFSFSSKNIFAHKSNSNMVILNGVQRLAFIIKCILAYSGGRQTSRIEQNIVAGFIVFTAMFKIFDHLKENYYVDQSSNRYSVFSITFSCVVVAVSVISHLVHEALIVDNEIIVSIIIGIFAVTSISVYLNNIKSEMCFKSFHEAIENNSIVSYLENHYKLWKNQKNNEDQVIFAGIKKIHTFNCTNHSCYCRAQNLQAKQFNQLFLKQYLNDMADFFSVQITTDRVRILILNFQLQIFQNPLKVARKIKNLKFYQSNSFDINLGLLQLQSRLSNFIGQKNHRQDSINVQLPAKLDEALIEIQKIVLNDIQTKNHKWQYLCQNLIKSLQIQEDIVKEIANISNFERIFHQNKQMFKKSLSFNAICLFYYAEVVFLKKEVMSLEQNLKQIKGVINYNFINSSKEMAKNMFDSRCGLLEIDLTQEEINDEFDFKVSSFNRNALHIFKQTKDGLCSKKIQNLYPGFLWSQIRPTFISYMKQNNEDVAHKSLETYFIDKDENVFKALQCLKLITRPSGIYLMVLLFEKESNKIVLLNESRTIQNVGESYKTYFGYTYQGVPFQALFYQENEYESLWTDEKFSLCNKFLIYGAEIGKQWKLYLQKIKSNMEKYYKKNNINRFSPTLKSFTNNKISQNVSQIISEERQKLMGSKISSESTYEKKQTVADDKNKSILVVTLQCKRCKIRDLSFYEVSMEGFKRKKPNRRRRTLFYMQIVNKCVNKSPQQVDHQMNERSLNEQKTQVIKDECLEHDDDQPASFGVEEGNSQVHAQENSIMLENSNIQSSIKGESLAYFYQNFIDICFNLFENPHEISDKRLSRFTCLSFFSSLFVALLVLGTYKIHDLGLYEVKDIFFADGAVSDNMQLSQFMYNRAMNFKQFKENSSEFEEIGESAYFEREYLFGLLKHDVGAMPFNVTEMTSTRFYEYLIVPVKWYSQDQTQIQIESGQLLQFYYYLTNQVAQFILNDTAEAQERVRNSLKLMNINFPELKRINHENLYLYKDMSDRTLSLIMLLTYTSGLAHVFLSAVIFFLFYNEKVFRRKQQVEGYSIYKLIPRKIIQILFTYYQNHGDNLRQSSDLLKYERHFGREGIYLPTDGSAFLRPNNSTFITNNFKSPLAIWKMVFVLIFINIIYASILLEVSNLAGPISKMMTNVNNLMDSQNYLLEAYFDLKAKFIIEQKFDVNETFFDSLLQSQKSNEVLFSQIAVQSLDLFSNYDQTYTQQFIGLLIKNICELAANDITPQQYDKCKSYFKIYMIDNGVITAMNFFTRRVKEKILECKKKLVSFKQKIIDQQQMSQILKSFESLDFRQIDESIIYMFKMYQSTQARIYLSLEKTIISLLYFSSIIVVVELIIIGFGYPLVLFMNLRNQKIELSKIYVSFLLIPTPVSRMIKAFAGKIEQVLEIDKNF